MPSGSFNLSNSGDIRSSSTSSLNESTGSLKRSSEGLYEKDIARASAKKPKAMARTRRSSGDTFEYDPEKPRELYKMLQNALTHKDKAERQKGIDTLIFKILKDPAIKTETKDRYILLLLDSSHKTCQKAGLHFLTDPIIIEENWSKRLELIENLAGNEEFAGNTLLMNHALESVADLVLAEDLEKASLTPKVINDLINKLKTQNTEKTAKATCKLFSHATSLNDTKSINLVTIAESLSKNSDPTIQKAGIRYLKQTAHANSTEGLKAAKLLARSKDSKIQQIGIEALTKRSKSPEDITDIIDFLSSIKSTTTQNALKEIITETLDSTEINDATKATIGKNLISSKNNDKNQLGIDFLNQFCSKAKNPIHIFNSLKLLTSDFKNLEQIEQIAAKIIQKSPTTLEKKLNIIIELNEVLPKKKSSQALVVKLMNTLLDEILKSDDIDQLEQICSRLKRYGEFSFIKKDEPLKLRIKNIFEKNDDELNKKIIEQHTQKELEENGFDLMALMKNASEVKDTPLEEIYKSTEESSSALDDFSNAVTSFFSVSTHTINTSSINKFKKIASNFLTEKAPDNSPDTLSMHLINNFFDQLDNTREVRNDIGKKSVQDRFAQILRFCELAPKDQVESVILTIATAARDCPDAVIEGLDQAEFEIAKAKALALGDPKEVDRILAQEFLRSGIAAEALEQNPGKESLETNMLLKRDLNPVLPINYKTKSVLNEHIAKYKPSFLTTTRVAKKQLNAGKFKLFLKQRNPEYESALKEYLAKAKETAIQEIPKKANTAYESIDDDSPQTTEESILKAFSDQGIQLNHDDVAKAALGEGDFEKINYSMADYAEAAYNAALGDAKKHTDAYLEQKENEFFKEYLKKSGLGG